MSRCIKSFQLKLLRLSVYIFSCFILSCNSSSNDQKSSSSSDSLAVRGDSLSVQDSVRANDTTRAKGLKPLFMGSKLHELILRNEQTSATEYNQLERLEGKKGHKVKKIIFQAVRTIDGELSLAAFVSENGNQDFDPLSEVLQVGDEVDDMDMAGKVVHFVNGEVTGKHLVKLFRQIASNYKYIIFAPKLQLLQGGRPNEYIVTYELYGSTSNSFFGADPLNIGWNPSPPKDAY